MSTKAKASPPKKSKSKSKVTHLDPKRIKESDKVRWERELYDFLKPLSESEFEIVRKLVDIISKRPSKRKEPCEVIQLVKGV